MTTSKYPLTSDVKGIDLTRYFLRVIIVYHQIRKGDKEMTRQEFFKAVSENDITPEVIEYALTEATKFEKQNAERIAEDATLHANIMELVAENNGIKAREVSEALSGVSIQKASSALRTLVNMGELVSSDEIEGRRVVKFYTLAK